MYVILVYDVSVERVNKVRQYLKQYLNWVQNSAFEGEMRRGEIEKVKIGLSKIMNEDEDSVILYTIRNKKWVVREIMGVEKSEIATIL